MLVRRVMQVRARPERAPRPPGSQPGRRLAVARRQPPERAFCIRPSCLGPSGSSSRVPVCVLPAPPDHPAGADDDYRYCTAVRRAFIAATDRASCVYGRRCCGYVHQRDRGAGRATLAPPWPPGTPRGNRRRGVQPLRPHPSLASLLHVAGGLAGGLPGGVDNWGVLSLSHTLCIPNSEQYHILRSIPHSDTNPSGTSVDSALLAKEATMQYLFSKFSGATFLVTPRQVKSDVLSARPLRGTDVYGEPPMALRQAMARLGGAVVEGGAEGRDQRTP